MSNAHPDVHGIDQAQPFLNVTFTETILDLRGDIQEGPALGYVEPELFTIGFHDGTPAVLGPVAKPAIRVLMTSFFTFAMCLAYLMLNQVKQ